MEGFRLIDIFSTKGIEYLLAGGFFVAFYGILKYMTGPAGEARREHVLSSVAEWFRVPQDLFYHRGHSWLRSEGEDTVTVGMDHYAARLVGPVGAVRLPEVGASLRQGEAGWAFQVDGSTIPMLSPVTGKVVEVNAAALADPLLVGRDPFGEGWLVKVKAEKVAANAMNLLTGKLAIQWVENSIEALRREGSGTVGLAMQDGGAPVDGIAKALYGDRWEAKVREELLAEG